jgi:hypothetical protein
MFKFFINGDEVETIRLNVKTIEEATNIVESLYNNNNPFSVITTRKREKIYYSLGLVGDDYEANMRTFEFEEMI